MISRKKVTTGMVFLWLLLSFVNILSQPEYVPFENNHNTEETSNEEAGDLVLKAKEAVQYSFNLNLSFQSFLLDVVELDDNQNELLPEVSTYIDSLTKKIGVLFKRIIVKNAP